MDTNAAVLGGAAGHGARKAVVNAGTMGVEQRRELREEKDAEKRWEDAGWAVGGLLKKARRNGSKKGGIGAFLLGGDVVFTKEAYWRRLWENPRRKTAGDRRYVWFGRLFWKRNDCVSKDSMYKGRCIGCRARSESCRKTLV